MIDGWTRRRLLRLLAEGALGLSACRRPGPRSRARFDGFPIARVDALLTPLDEFFVRDHFGLPEVAGRADGWRLSIEGEVEAPLSLSLAELSQTPVELPVTLECAGNAGRNGLGPPGAGRAFSGASTGSFAGVSLAGLLGRAKPRPGAVEVVSVGADEGSESGDPARRPFARSVPLEAALAPSALLATRMNGGPLPALHGGPLRAIFPGRYATDSVKWLRRLIVVSKPFEGFYQRRRYVRVSDDAPDGRTLGELRIQSEIGRPRPGARLPAGLEVDVIGAAWGGRGGAARMEISVDGGRTFHEAELLDPPNPFAWRRFHWRWTPATRGPRLLFARATDRAGNSQPLQSDEEGGRSRSRSGPDRIQYANDSALIVPVWVV